MDLQIILRPLQSSLLSSKPTIGLFGGSFHPAHDGHRHVALTALKRLRLHQVSWIVARGNPLKSDHGAFAARYASAKRRASHPLMSASDIEQRLGLTYTADTVAILKARHPTVRFVWIVGADSIKQFHLWKDWQYLAETVPIAIVSRPGARPGNSPFERRYMRYRVPEHAAARLIRETAPAWTWLKAPFHPVSSTALRAGHG